MSRQLSFDLASVPALGREAFFVSTCNANAVAMVEGWQGWTARKLLLCGQTGSGKTHLAHVWAALAQARIVAAHELGDADIADLAQGSVAVEDAQGVAGNSTLEEALFHLHNLVLAEGHSLLLTSQGIAGSWGLSLPDLASRMEGTPEVKIGQPDDALLSAVLVKLFSDRQLRPSPETIAFLVPRMPRSFGAAHAIVDALDATALETAKPITRRMAQLVLDNLTDQGQSPLSPYLETRRNTP